MGMRAVKAFVLLSGGIDSTVCLAMAAGAFGAEQTHAFTVYYGQRHAKEIAAAKEICRDQGIQCSELMMHGIPRSLLTDESQQVPNKSYDEIEGKSPAYVPYRNGMLLSRATAEIVDRIGDRDQAFLYMGVHAEDAANWAYADCTPEFIGAQANAIFIGTYQKVRLKAPLLEMNKADIVAWGDNMGVPLKLTWSCYAGGEKHCGTCMTCRARKDAFLNAGVKDPTEYAA